MTTGSSSVPATVASLQGDFSRIPRELRDRNQWCYTLPSDPDPRKRKAPRKAGNALADATNPNDWMDFNTAAKWALYVGGRVGYCLSANDPFACIDLDVKPGTTPRQLVSFQTIVNDFASYSEFSQSGLGMHVWVRGKTGSGRRDSFDGVEVYSQERFIICTGNPYLDIPIAERQALLARLVGGMRGSLGSMPNLPPDGPQTLGDDQLLDRARAADNGAAFTALWEGRWQGTYGSASEADLALMADLGFYSPNNAQCCRLFLRSALGGRDKIAGAKPERRWYLLRRLLSVVRNRSGASADHGRQIAEALFKRQAGQKNEATNQLEAVLRFDPEKTDPQAPDLVDGLVADEETTLLGGHGGIGKGFLSLQIAVAVALGQRVLNHETPRAQRVLYYSAEDGRKRIGARLRKLMEDLCPEERALVKQNLCLIDASELDPLFGSIGKDKVGPLSTWTDLQRISERFDQQLTIFDGASDTFDGNEIKRREVRPFVKLLTRVNPKRKTAALLIVHIDRASARGLVSNDEGYAGNAAWHNSCRRRLYLQRKVERDSETKEEIGETITLRVMKNQDGPGAPDMEVVRQDTGFWTPAVSFSGMNERGGDYAPIVLRLIGEYYERRKWISTSLAANATTGVFPTLKGDPNFPPLDRKRTAAIVRQLEREQKLEPEEYRRNNGGKAERWKPT